MHGDTHDGNRSSEASSSPNSRADRQPRADGGTVQAEWTGSNPPVVAVVDAVADATGRDPDAVGPLYDSVDPSALTTLLQTGGDGDNPVTISFTYDGCDISVSSSGEITVTPNGHA